MSGNYSDSVYSDSYNDSYRDNEPVRFDDDNNNNSSTYRDYDDDNKNYHDADNYGYEEPYSRGDDNRDANRVRFDSDNKDNGRTEEGEDYEYDNEAEYYDDEGKPLSESNLNRAERDPKQENYNDEYDDDDQYYYGDEQDDEERRRRARRRRAWCCCLILLCCLLLLIILLIVFLLSLRRDDNVQTEPPTYAPFIDDADDDYTYDDDIVLTPGVITTPMQPYNRECEDSDGKDMSDEGFRNVFDQCDCTGEVYFVPDDVQDMRELLIERVGPKFYDDDNITLPLNSCDPVNMAFIWLASGDNRDAGEPRQRFAAALTFFQLNGTVWDFHDEWLGELNECLWMGIQCNNYDTVNSLAVDTNNLFGQVGKLEGVDKYSRSFVLSFCSPHCCFFSTIFMLLLLDTDGDCSTARTCDDCAITCTLDWNYPHGTLLHAPIEGAASLRESINGEYPTRCPVRYQIAKFEGGNQLFRWHVGNGNWSRQYLDRSKYWLQ
jgi:hypothetical protein